VEDPQYVRKYDTRVAVVVGDKAATFIQQVHYHAFWKETKYGTREWRSSISEWEQTFPHWSRITIRRIISDLREKKVLIARKQATHVGTAVWFSLDYDVLDQIGAEGEAKIAAGLAKEVEDQNEQHLATPAQNEQHLGIKMSITPAQNEHHLVKQSNTSLSSTIKSSEGKPSLSKDEKDKNLQEKLKATALLKSRSRFDKTFSTTAVADHWKVSSLSVFGKDGYVPLDTKAKSLVKSGFNTWCIDADIHLLDFLDWCIAHWVELRDVRIKWPKLPTHPTFMTIYNHKDVFLSQYRKNGGSENVVSKGQVYTSVSQIPKDHPLYKQLKYMVEETGKAEVV